jgi:hypothetical protein
MKTIDWECIVSTRYYFNTAAYILTIGKEKIVVFQELQRLKIDADSSAEATRKSPHVPGHCRPEHKGIGCTQPKG